MSSINSNGSKTHKEKPILPKKTDAEIIIHPDPKVFELRENKGTGLFLRPVGSHVTNPFATVPSASSNDAAQAQVSATSLPASSTPANSSANSQPKQSKSNES